VSRSTLSDAQARPGRASSYDRSRRLREDRRLFVRYRLTRDLAARDALFDRFLPLANHLARRYDRGGGHDEDVAQVACVGLMQAIERFDPDRGIAFSSYAVPTIIGEIKRYFRDRGWLVRVPRELQERALTVQSTANALEAELGRAPTTAQLAERLNLTIEAVVEARMAAGAHFGVSLDRPNPDGEEDSHSAAAELGAEDPGFSRAEDAATLDGLLADLDERQSTILRLRFEHDLTQAEIAERVGISQMHVSRLIREAVTELQTAHPTLS
jgi:RNA polymerase sigma-B factor